MTYKSNLAAVAVFLFSETEKAWLLSALGTRTSAVWFPKSQGELHLDDRGDLLILTAPEWLLLEKGLI